jgi:predicted PurR-regulated permease PerM
MTALGWRSLVVVALAAVIARLALALSTTTLAILVGAIVGATFLPVVRYLRVERSWSPGRAAGLASLLALGTVLVIVVLVVIAFAPYVGSMIQSVRDGVAQILARLTELGAPPALVDYVRRLATGVEGWLSGAVGQLVGPVGTLVTILILGGFLTFYLLADGDRAWARLTAELDDRNADTLTSAAVEALERVGGYLRGESATAVVSAITQTVYLFALGVPLAGPLGVLVFLGGFVPYVGAFFTTIVVLLMAFAFGGVPAAVVLLVLIAVTAVAQRWLSHRSPARKRVRIHPALILVVVPAGAALFGIAGVFLAVPLVATGMAFAPAAIAILDAAPAGRRSALSVPVWLDRLAQWGWHALVVIAVAAVAAQVLVAPVLSAPVVIALVVACAMHPAWKGLVARGVGPTQAALAITLLSGLVVALIAIVTFITVIRELPEILGEAADGAASIGIGATPGDLVGTIGPTLLANAGAIVSNVASISVALVTAAFLTFFFLRDGGGWWQRLLGRVPGDRREIVGSSGATAARILNGSTLGTGLVSVIAGTLQFLMMTVLGLPLAFPVGVLTFFGGFIPYIGGFIASGLAFLIAIAAGNPTTVALMAVFTVAINIFIGNFVAPFVLGKTVSVHPAVILLAAPAGAAIGGLVGMFLIVPVIAIVMATWRSVLRLFDPHAELPPAEVAPPSSTTTRPATGRAAPSPATG